MSEANTPNASRRRGVATLISVALSILLLCLLYRSIDLRGVGQVLRQADGTSVIISLGVIIPITIARALRFMWLLPASARRGLRDATILTLISTTFNVFLPAKTGDFAKSFVVAKRGGTTGAVSVAIIVYERLADMVGMLAWCLAGYLIVRPVTPLLPPIFWLCLALVGALCAMLLLSERAAGLLPRAVRAVPFGGRFDRIVQMLESWPTLLTSLRGRRLWLALFSIALWFLQLYQIWLFTVAVKVDIPFAVCTSLSAVALLVAQLPITFGGVGTRDIALVLLLSAYMTPEQAAAVGVLITLRGFLVLIAGLPLVRSYVLNAIRADRVQGASVVGPPAFPTLRLRRSARPE